MRHDWQRVASFVKARRQHLGIKQTDTEDVSPATWTNIEGGKQESYKPFTLAAIERALRWPAGTIKHVAAGGDPPESGDGSLLAEEIDELKERLTRLEKQIARLVRGVR